MAILAARLRGLSDEGVVRAMSSALTFIAKDYAAAKRRSVDRDIDRPTRFTKLGYDWDGARINSGRLESRAFVRPKQAEYLKWAEFGGEKRRSIGVKGGPVSIRPGFQDRYGGGWGRDGFKKKWLNRSSARAANPPAGGYRGGTKLYRVFSLNTGGGTPVTGIWQLTKQSRASRAASGKSWKTRLIVKFEEKGTYDNPRLHFRRDGKSFAQARLPRLAQRMLDRELQRLR